MDKSNINLWKGFYTEDINLLEIVFTTLSRFPFENLKLAFKKWKNYLEQLAIHKKKINDARLSRDIIHVFKTSTRFKRTLMEKKVIKKYLKVFTSCIPVKLMTKQEIDILCNEIDILKCFGKAIVFLQGDYGNRYFSVARGQVSLYQEESIDRQVENARKYGDYRGLEFPGSDEEMSKLGTKVAVLSPGSGFGELSILSSTHKFRTASAICNQNDSLLFVLHEKTYNEVLRRHHFRQQEMSTAITFLKNIPLCKFYSFSKLAKLAYDMKSSSYQKKFNVLKAGDAIKNVFFVRSGEVCVSQPLEKGKKHKNSPHNMPSLALNILTTGKILGEFDILSNESCYSSTYMTKTDSEFFELPLHLFLDALKTGDRTYQISENSSLTLKNLNDKRAERAKESITSFLTSVEKSKLKEMLVKNLPNIIDIDSINSLAKSKNTSENFNISLSDDMMPTSSISISSTFESCSLQPSSPSGFKKSFHSPKIRF